MRRVLVTGAAGFVGRHVLPRLADRAFEVHAVSSRAHHGLEASVCRWHRADLLDGRQREALLADVKPEVLLHLAWHAKPPAYWSAAENVEWLSSSLDLFRLFAHNGGTRIVGAGSGMEYDWRHGYCTEGVTPLEPATLYGASKGACGTVLDHYSRQVGIDAAWGRIFFVFGPYDSPLRLVPSLVQAIAAGRTARCHNGSHVRDFLHVDDVAGALVALLESDVTGPVNIASGTPLRVGEVASQIGLALDRAELLTIEEGPVEHRLVCANIARLRTEVGWRPARDVRERLEETIHWWASSKASQVTT